MDNILFYSTNNKSEKVDFRTALLKGQPSDFGLYMMARNDLPKFSIDHLMDMKSMPYADIAFEVLNPFLKNNIPKDKLKAILNDAYREDKIPTNIQNITGRTHAMWLTQGPTYSFKDYAADFSQELLDYFLGELGKKKTVVVATSGDTGGAVADGLYGLENVNNVVFFPKGSISEGQRRQMTTLGDNIYAFEVNGDFDVCQALAKKLLNDEEFAQEVFGDKERITSANSISVGRLLPQTVYPFFAYSRVAENGEPMIASIPSGNFGDMSGTVLAKYMGIPISNILCGVNENTVFADFWRTGKYNVGPSKASPSSAMNVSHPSNLARLIDFYGGHMFDKRDPVTNKVIEPGIITKMPNLGELRHDIFSMSINNEQHYKTMKEVFEKHNVILDPHGAVGWEIMKIFTGGHHDQLSVIYETADPGKFPIDVEKAIGIKPELPSGMKKQAELEERIFSIESAPDITEQGLKLSDSQEKEAKYKIKELLAT